MKQVNRRELLMGGAALAALGAIESANASPGTPRASTDRHSVDVNQVEKVAENVYFHEGDIAGKGHCNNGWIVFDDFVLVIDANFPSGAQEILPKIKAITDKPIRFVFDTHHHGDHAYGNHFWVENGVTPVAYTGVIDEMKKYETGFYGGAPGRWESTAMNRPDVKASRLHPPTVVFPKDLVFDDGKMRVELVYLGIAHTKGDAYAWLPKQKILFTGDVCVNGPYNYMGDGDSEQWIKTLAEAKKLGVEIICPAHGPRSVDSLLVDQRQYFVTLRDTVGKAIKPNASADAIKQATPMIQQQIEQKKQISKYVGSMFSSQVAKVAAELSGRTS
jgi:glyoxylase-like metal-dependent hydrolase (beta-lactamase superfamily II)